MTNSSAVERVTASLELAHATQATLNAFISLDDERALERASEIDDRVAGGDDVGALAGVPIGLKDLIDHRGRVTTCGSAFYAVTAERTAESVRRLENAGAVIVGRTNLHEWAFGFNSENEHWGPVRNPWDIRTSAGGSSGGSGAAVAAGITPISIGTDTGGSVRVPAALCGTFGLKVTHGRVSLDGVFPLVPSIDTVGPLADSMDNIESSYRVLSGDNTPLPESRALRIGVPEPWYADAPLHDDIRGDFEKAVDSIRALGHEVHPIQLPDVKPTYQLIDAIGLEVTEAHREFRRRGEHYSEAVRARIEVAESVTPEAADAARKWQEMLRDRFSDAFSTVDLLITPGCAWPQKVIGEEMIGDKNHRSVISYFSAVVNHALLPGLAMPITGSGRPPASLQAIGDLHSEPLLIEFGKSLESEGLVGFEVAPLKST